MLNWFQFVRPGLVQLCLGAAVVLTTNTLNRLMVVELAVPAALPGILVALHCAVQVARPNWGHRSEPMASAAGSSFWAWKHPRAGPFWPRWLWW